MRNEEKWMSQVFVGSVARARVVVLCVLAIFVVGCRHNTDFNGQRVIRRPRARIGRYASPTVGTYFADPRYLGEHGYYNGALENLGILYTCKAGHIDLAHVRKAADCTAYLAANIREQLNRGRREFSFKFKEPSRYFVKVTYPDWWKDLPPDEKGRIAEDISIRLGEYFAYTACTWHEILTWFGYRSVGLYPEFPSSFSWEDSFSDLLGTYLGAKALRDKERGYDEAMTLALERELEDLGVQPKKVCVKASKMVRGKWFSGDFLFLVDMKARNLDIGVDDGYVTPWLVPGLEECAGAVPRSYPAPSLDFLQEYGFVVKFEIEPRELERGKILSIIYPEKKERKRRIEPAVHFALIMERIEKEAVEKYGCLIEPAGEVPPAGADRAEDVSENGGVRGGTGPTDGHSPGSEAAGCGNK